MDGIKLGVILRESFSAESETHNILKAMHADHILLHAQFGRPAGEKRATKSKKLTSSMTKQACKFSEELSILLAGETSIFIPAHVKETYNNVIMTNKMFIEVDPDKNNEMDITKLLVSKITNARPVIEIGIVSPLYQWLTNDELANLISYGNNLFPCPIIGSGPNSLDVQFEAASTLPGAIPFLVELSDVDKANLPDVLARYCGTFAEIIFWTPQTARGIDLDEVQMKRQKSKKKSDVMVPQGSRQVYRALQPVALREEATRNSAVKGTAVVGQLYNIVGEPRKDKMGAIFGQLDNTLWVMLKDGQDYFEKETYSDEKV